MFLKQDLFLKTFLAHMRPCMYIYMCMYRFSLAETKMLSLLAPVTVTWVAMETWKIC